MSCFRFRRPPLVVFRLQVVFLLQVECRQVEFRSRR